MKFAPRKDAEKGDGHRRTLWNDIRRRYSLREETVPMITLHERYVVDERGNKTAVLLEMDEYRKLLEEVEELEAIRAYDAARASGDEEIPFEQAVAEIESKR
ncbi:MAG: hypothetical protein NFCOHLIN_02951 [Gammaproteobacteria bacterium]|nr:hypothetical protein [Gammaproteobacteria bacterium]